MRLPQDRILHIGTELKDGKVNIVAEWQGELVRCKDCKHRYYADNRIPQERDWVCDWWRKDGCDEKGFCSYGERKESE